MKDLKPRQRSRSKSPKPLSAAARCVLIQIKTESHEAGNQVLPQNAGPRLGSDKFFRLEQALLVSKRFRPGVR